RRMRADWLRGQGKGAELEAEYRQLIEAYGKAGLGYERALSGLSYASWLHGRGRRQDALDQLHQTRAIIEQGNLCGLRADLFHWLAAAGEAHDVSAERERCGIHGPARP